MKKASPRSRKEPSRSFHRRWSCNPCRNPSTNPHPIRITKKLMKINISSIQRSENSIERSIFLEIFTKITSLFQFSDQLLPSYVQARPDGSLRNAEQLGDFAVGKLFNCEK